VFATVTGAAHATTTPVQEDVSTHYYFKEPKRKNALMERAFYYQNVFSNKPLAA
jgi:hypothetical protein